MDGLTKVGNDLKALEKAFPDLEEFSLISSSIVFNPFILFFGIST